MNFAGIIKTEETAIAKEDISFGDRILFVLEQQRRSKAWLAEQIGISKQAINYLLNHSSNPRYVNEIATALEISPEWLLFGKGSQQINSEKDAGIIRIPILTLDSIPHFIKSGGEQDSEKFTHISLNGASSSCFATILDNSSMEPLFNQGTLLIFNPHINPKSGDYIIFSSERNIYFRQYLIDGNEIHLKAVDIMFKTFNKKDILILGVLIESRNHFT